MNTIPRAEDLLNKYRFKAGEHIGNNDYDLMAQYAIEFAKLHVQEALKQASEIDIIVEKRSQYGKYRKWQKIKEDEEFDLFNFEIKTSQNKKGILNAYSLENIK